MHLESKTAALLIHWPLKRSPKCNLSRNLRTARRSPTALPAPPHKGKWLSEVDQSEKPTEFQTNVRSQNA